MTQLRKFRQVSLRTAIVLLTLGCILLSGLAFIIRQARIQQDAVASLRRFGAFVRYEKTDRAQWLQDLLGNDFMVRVKSVDYIDDPFVTRPDVTDADLRKIGCLRHLQFLELSGSEADGSFLEHLASPQQLEGLILADGRVNDDAMKFLARCENLRQLDLSGNPLTDAGISQLGNLQHLERLTWCAPV